ncbi:hypothetical protein [Microvirga roseola]|uniref:hypothetical protein n=1 Tax=Microvirga roseola TaxID=2883126 RepID=UPI001E2DE765|nr:hypothetical protein [Microvirga roseola]
MGLRPAMQDYEAWELERQFWTGGLEFYERHLDCECLMALPGVGVMRAAEILASMKDAPRWVSVEMAERAMTKPSEIILVLAYRATGHRNGSAPYNAVCTSTHRAAGTMWKLVQHQQTLVR